MNEINNPKDIYEAFNVFIDIFLENNKSIFSDKSVFTESNLKVIIDNFVNKPDDSKNSFSEKIKKQIGEDGDVRELFAHVIWLWSLTSSDMILESKIEGINEWLAEETKIDKNFSFVFDHGIMSTGIHHKTNKPLELIYIIYFFSRCLNNNEKLNVKYIEILKAGVMNDIDIKPNQICHKNQKPVKSTTYNLLLHLINPERYIDIASYGDKQKLVNYFSTQFNVTFDNNDDLDDKIYKLKKICIEKHGNRYPYTWNSLYENYSFNKFDFYHPDLKYFWNNTSSKIQEKDVIYNSKEKESNNMKDGQPPLNQILYGPPGTGKTYHTVNRAIEIVEINYFNKFKDDRKKLKEKFEELSNTGQIKFVTFHQNYGYEEFVQGIKPIPKGENGNDTDEMIYKVVNGIFKNISETASDNYYNSLKEKDEIIQETKIESLLSQFNQYLVNMFDEGKEFVLKGKATIKNINSQNGYQLGGSVSSATLSPKIIKRDYSLFKKGKIKSELEIKPSRESQQKSIGNSNYYFALYQKLKEWEVSNMKKPPEEGKAEQQKLKNYILIIDEINRGNISKIFGELITIIEESKRLGFDEEIKVTLPYSKDEDEDFGVPKNLYIIGTMNTADRSIALMDTALRRRFEFIEMMPKHEILKKVQINDFKEIQLDKLLETINQRIEYLYDRDHMIGHSYLMNLNSKEELDRAFKNKIIPLLQEYFYDDWEKIQIVLGDHKDQGVDDENKFITSEKFNDDKVLGFGYNEIDEDKKKYSINDDSFTKIAYLKIYRSEKQTND